MKQITFNGHKNVIADALKIQRQGCRLSQGALAAKMQTLGCNIDQQMISKIEKNTRQVTDYELACFCVCLRISPNTLLRDFFADGRESLLRS